MGGENVTIRTVTRFGQLASVTPTVASSLHSVMDLLMIRTGRAWRQINADQVDQFRGMLPLGRSTII